MSRWRWTFSLGSFVVGGTRRFGGWIIAPHLTFDAHHLTVGVAWQRRAFEDPDPELDLFLLPAVCLWFRFYRVLPGYRAKRREWRRQEREHGYGEWPDA